MLSLGIHYYPLTLPFLLVLLVGLVALAFLAVLRVLQFAYSQLGIAPGGVAVVPLPCYLLAEPVPGLGIAVPVFYPPVIAAVVALLLSRRLAAPLAYVCGSLGTLIGADLMHLADFRGLGAPVASIGGAGTFDAIFVSALLGVLIAGILSRRKIAQSARARP